MGVKRKVVSDGHGARVEGKGSMRAGVEGLCGEARVTYEGHCVSLQVRVTLWSHCVLGHMRVTVGHFSGTDDTLEPPRRHFGSTLGSF